MCHASACVCTVCRMWCVLRSVDILLCCLASDSKVLTYAAVWRMPKELEPGSHESPDDSSSTAHTLELLCHLDNTAHGSMAW